MTIAEIGENNPVATEQSQLPRPNSVVPKSPIDRWIIVVRNFVVLPIIGILVPIALLTQAYISTGSLNATLFDSGDLKHVVDTWIPPKVQRLESPMDYSLYAVVFLELGNRQMMLNKQRMKTATIQIGFAVAFVGIMLLILSIDSGGIEAGGSAGSGLSFNVKTTSTGAAVFVLGAAMSAAGALVPNEYKTVAVPGYSTEGGKPADAQRGMRPSDLEDLQRTINICLKNSATEEDRQKCVVIQVLDAIRKYSVHTR